MEMQEHIVHTTPKFNIINGWLWIVVLSMTVITANPPERYSQLKPSYKIKTCIGGWSNDTAKSSQLARNHSIRLNKTALSYNNNKTTWFELTEVAKTVENVSRVGREFELVTTFKPTRAKWVAKRYPTPSKLWTWLELAWDGRTVWPGLKVIRHFVQKLSCLPSHVIKGKKQNKRNTFLNFVQE